LNICLAAKEAGNIRVIHKSTCEVYGTALYVPIDEKHPKQKQFPYSANKIGADVLMINNSWFIENCLLKYRFKVLFGTENKVKSFNTK